MATSDAAEDISPSWLDSAFVAGILSKELGQPVRVRQLRVSRAVGKGENYASLLLRVGADYEAEGDDAPRSTSLIVKCFPTGEIMRQFVRESGVFVRETRMYLETIPKLEELINAVTPGGGIVFGAKAYEAGREDTVVLQDLRELGFRMADRHAGLDLAHASLVLRLLARFHASSVALHQHEPQHVEGYSEVLYSAAKRQQIGRFVPQTLDSVAKVVDKFEETDPKFAGYADRVRKFSLTAIDKVIEAVSPSATFLNVLNHGDCWVNNCLFKYNDSAELQETRFLDFQIVRYASPTLDLQYLLYTSVQADVRETQWELLLQTYARELQASLRALGQAEAAEGVSAAALQSDMEARSAFGVVSACTVLCAIVADPADALNLEGHSVEEGKEQEANSKVFERALAGKRFGEALKRLLPCFVESGAL